MSRLCHAGEMRIVVDCEYVALAIHVLKAIAHGGIHRTVAWLYHLLFCSAKTSPFHLLSIRPLHDNQPVS